MRRASAVVAVALVTALAIVAEPGARQIAGGSTDSAESIWTWDVGELVAGTTYETALAIENACTATRIVSISTKNLGEVAFDAAGCHVGSPDKTCSLSVPPGTAQVAMRIEPAEWWYYVDRMTPWATPRPARPVVGEIVIDHERSGGCRQRREIYAVSFTIKAARAELPPPKGRGDAVFCKAWWHTGQRPTILKPGQDCTSVIRPLAMRFRERILPPYVEKAPDQWAWLPATAEIGAMSDEELVAMRVRAAALMAPQE